MNYWQLINELKIAALENPYVKTWIPDVNTINSYHDLRYGVVALEQGTSQIDKKGWITWSGTLYYINRVIDSPSDNETSRKEDNALEIQAQGITILHNMVKTLGGIGVDSVNYSVFKHKFLDYCAGASVQVTLRTPFSICWDDFANPESNEYTLNVLITNGTVNATLHGVPIQLPYTGPKGSVISLEVIPNENYRFRQWTDGNTSNPRTIILNSDRSLSCVCEYAVKRTLTFLGTHCTCSPSTYEGYSGDTVSVYVSSNEAHYHWSHWNDGNTSNPRTFTVGTEDETYTAYFEQDAQYTLLFTATHGTVSQESFTGYTGDSVTITVTPDSGYVFEKWNDGNTEQSRTFTIGTASVSYTATCKSATVYKTLTFNSEPYGTVSATVDGVAVTSPAQVAVGSSVVLTATATTQHWHFTEWVGTTMTSVNPYSFTMPSNDVTENAAYEQDPQYTLTFNGVNCTCNPSTYTGYEGDQVTVTVTPNEHYVHGTWNDGVSTENPRTFTVGSAAATYTATCTQESQYVVSATTTGCSVTGGGSYYAGDSVTLVATPESHFSMAEQSWDFPTGLVVTYNETYTEAYFTMPAYNVYVSVDAVQDPQYTLTFVGVNGTVSQSSFIGYTGEQVTITVTPNTHYHHGTWNDGVSTSTPRTFTIGAQSLTYTATCDEDSKYAVEVTPTGCTISGNDDYYTGDSVRIVATPDSHMHMVQSSWDFPAIVSVTYSQNYTVAEFTMPAQAVYATADAVTDPQYTLTFAGVHCTCTPSTYEGYTGDQVTITVTPDSGYVFGSWNDGNTDNPRTFTIGTSSVTYTATCTSSYDVLLNLKASEYGSVNAVINGVTYTEFPVYVPVATPITINAVADTTNDVSYYFNKWSDNVTSSSRTITLTANLTLGASFCRTITVPLPSGNCYVMCQYESGRSTYYCIESFHCVFPEGVIVKKDGQVITQDYDYSFESGQVPSAYTSTITYESEDGTVTSSATCYFPWCITTGLSRNFENQQGGGTTGDCKPLPTIRTLTFSATNGSVEAYNNNIEVTSPFKGFDSDVVTLTCIPNSGYAFRSWSDGVTTISRSVTLTSNLTLTATCDAAYEVTCATTNCSVTGTGTYFVGDSVTLTATPITHYLLDVTSWTNMPTGTTYSSDYKTATFTMPSSAVSCNCDAVAEPQYTLSFSAVHGSVSQASFTGYTGDQVTITVTPDSGYVFGSWNDGNVDNPRTFTVGSSAATYSATCIYTGTYLLDATIRQGEQYVTAITATVGGSVVTLPAYVASGASVTLTADVVSGHFASWSDNVGEVLVSPFSTFAFLMPAYSASFTVDTSTDGFTMTVGVNDSTLGSAYASYTSQYGTTYMHNTFNLSRDDYDFQVTAEPNSGITFSQWSDGSTDNPHTINAYSVVGSTLSMIATLAQPQYTLTFNGVNGTCSPSTFTGVTGSTVEVTVTPDSGYEFISWNDGDTNNPRTFTVGSSSTSYTATCTQPITWTGLTFTANTAGSTIQLKQNGTYSGTWPIETSTDGSIWSSYTLGTDITLTNVGDKVYFRGTKDSTAQASSIYRKFVMTGSIAASGDVTSLLNGTGGVLDLTPYGTYTFYYLFRQCIVLTTAPSLPATTLASRCYSQMFQDCTSLVTAPSLPATTLASRCYSQMFQGCTSLVTAPALPAITLAQYCYQSMFQGCTSLTTAPSLPATTLAAYCYYHMFQGCTSLTTPPPSLPATTLTVLCYGSMFYGCTSLVTAPSLPATTLTGLCYGYMFYGCTALTSAPTLPAITLAQYCYQSMFQGCTSLTTAPSLPATTLTDGCYQSMFQGCTSLTTPPPSLPATTLTVLCYGYMFNGCTSLVTAPALPAITLAQYCYQSMFQGCTSLTSAPSLPATTLAAYCYNHMFSGCTRISSITCYATDISATDCTTNWLNNVSSTGDFYTPSTTSWTTGQSGIPSGWTRIDL